MPTLVTFVPLLKFALTAQACLSMKTILLFSLTNEMNEWKCIDLKCVRKPTKSLNTPCKQIQPLSRVKSLDGSRVRGISPVGKEKVYRGKDLLESHVLSSEWNTERVREDASDDSEDGEDDKLPLCVIGESTGDCVWRGSRRRVGSRSSFDILN